MKYKVLGGLIVQNLNPFSINPVRKNILSQCSCAQVKRFSSVPNMEYTRCAKPLDMPLSLSVVRLTCIAGLERLD